MYFSIGSDSYSFNEKYLRKILEKKNKNLNYLSFNFKFNVDSIQMGCSKFV